MVKINSILKLEALEESSLNPAIDLYMATFSQAPWFDVFESKAQVETFFQNHLSNNYFVGYVLYLNTDIVAVSLGFSKPWIKGMEYYIDEFCVDYRRQGQGIGSQFIQLIEADVLSKGMNAIILNTEVDFPAQKFYLKNGFKELKEIIVLAK